MKPFAAVPWRNSHDVNYSSRLPNINELGWLPGGEATRFREDFVSYGNFDYEYDNDNDQVNRLMNKTKGDGERKPAPT